MMKHCSILALAAFAATTAFAKTSTPEGWTDDYDAALVRAADEGKSIVADFSGSDWCVWCKRLDEEVFATREFMKEASAKYVLLMVDSPRDKSLLSEKAKKQNPELVKKYKIKGYPTVLVLDAKGSAVAQLGYQRGGPKKYLETLAAEVRAAPDVAKYIRPVEEILSRSEEAMQDEVQTILDEAKEKFPVPADATTEQKQKLQQEASEYAQNAFYEKVLPKYVELYEKSIKEARAVKVPEKMKARRDALVANQEMQLSSFKRALTEWRTEKESQKKAKGGTSGKKSE